MNRVASCRCGNTRIGPCWCAATSVLANGILLLVVLVTLKFVQCWFFWSVWFSLLDAIERGWNVMIDGFTLLELGGNGVPLPPVGLILHSGLRHIHHLYSCFQLRNAPTGRRELTCLFLFLYFIITLLSYVYDDVLFFVFQPIITDDWCSPDYC